MWYGAPRHDPGDDVNVGAVEGSRRHEQAGVWWAHHGRSDEVEREAIPPSVNVDTPRHDDGVAAVGAKREADLRDLLTPDLDCRNARGLALEKEEDRCIEVWRTGHGQPGINKCLGRYRNLAQTRVVKAGELAQEAFNSFRGIEAHPGGHDDRRLTEASSAAPGRGRREHSRATQVT